MLTQNAAVSGGGDVKLLAKGGSVGAQIQSTNDERGVCIALRESRREPRGGAQNVLQQPAIAANTELLAPGRINGTEHNAHTVCNSQQVQAVPGH